MIDLAAIANCRLDATPDDNGVIVPECYRLDTGERCWTHAPTTSPQNALGSWEVHVADDLGICATCGEPSLRGERTNMAECEVCWLLAHADDGIWPRDCPPFPRGGDGAHDLPRPSRG